MTSHGQSSLSLASWEEFSFLQTPWTHFAYSQFLHHTQFHRIPTLISETLGYELSGYSLFSQNSEFLNYSNKHLIILCQTLLWQILHKWS